VVTASDVTRSRERFRKRLEQLEAILPVRNGRVVPDIDDLIIGGAKRLTVAVLFLDICGFSRNASRTDEEQDRVLKILNLFMAEMLYVVREHKGHFEKNTGDGLMAYFGEDTPEACTRKALEAALTMHCFNDQVISPQLIQLGLPEVKFRVGVETGPVTIANVGVRGDHRSLVAIGNTPNVACKMMKLLPTGGVVFGDHARSLLSQHWQNETVIIGALDGYVFTNTNIPYTAWELKYRVPAPMDLGSLIGSLPYGGL
jgi:adenylate cyclase